MKVKSLVAMIGLVRELLPGKNWNHDQECPSTMQVVSYLVDIVESEAFVNVTACKGRKTGLEQVLMDCNGDPLCIVENVWELFVKDPVSARCINNGICEEESFTNLLNAYGECQVSLSSTMNETLTTLCLYNGGNETSCAHVSETMDMVCGFNNMTGTICNTPVSEMTQAAKEVCEKKTSMALTCPTADDVSLFLQTVECRRGGRFRKLDLACVKEKVCDFKNEFSSDCDAKEIICAKFPKHFCEAWELCG